MGAAALLPTSAQAAWSAAREWNEQLMYAIRLNVPNPPAHARNLFHVAVAMYDAWAAYDTTAVGYIYNEKGPPLGWEWELIDARNEAISYAAYRILKTRFHRDTFPPLFPDAKITAVHTSLDNKFTAMGYDKDNAIAPTTNGATSAELGKRIGQAILTWGAGDGFSPAPPYTVADNPNMQTSPVNLSLTVLGQNGSFQLNMPLGFGLPAGTNPNYWQPLSLSAVVDQNGNVFPGSTQTFVGAQGMVTTPFNLTRTDNSKPWIDLAGGPSRLNTTGSLNPADVASDAAYKDNAMDVLRKSARLNDNTVVDYSPKAYGDNPLGTDTGTGRLINPVTGIAYAANPVKTGDFFRVLAEFWADGPNSETPPGHWHVLANEMSDNPLTEKKIRGTGTPVSDLEWDVKMYFALSGATHDAACAAWALKRYYSGTRPITMIRYMGSKGQSSDPGADSYDPQGLPLEPGVCELITGGKGGTSEPGGKHEKIWDVKYNAEFDGAFYVGQVAVKSWPGESPLNAPAPSVAQNQSLVRWQLAKDWLPFQRKTFNTPAFPGFISGHSTFSRAAAEALVLYTGSVYFPGGFGHHTVGANTMQIDKGPSADVDLQWCTYYDAADQAGQSRRWGGIHPYEDDYVGRQTGAVVGKSAFALAEKYWTGTIGADTIVAALTVSGANAIVTWNATRGMSHKVQTSPDMSAWTDATTYALAYDNKGSWTDPAPLPGRKFYRVLRAAAP